MGDPRVGILESDFRPQVSGLCNLQHIWQTLQLACCRGALGAARLSRRVICVLVVEELDAFEILGTERAVLRSGYTAEAVPERLVAKKRLLGHSGRPLVTIHVTGLRWVLDEGLAEGEVPADTPVRGLAALLETVSIIVDSVSGTDVGDNVSACGPLSCAIDLQAPSAPAQSTLKVPKSTGARGMSRSALPGGKDWLYSVSYSALNTPWRRAIVAKKLVPVNPILVRE